jgi:hypothetical protein
VSTVWFRRNLFGEDPSHSSLKVLSVTRLSVPLFCLAIAVGCASSQRPASRRSDLSLEDLINRNAEARGGRAAIDAVRALEVRVRIEEPTYTAEGTYRVDRAGRMRIDVLIGGKRIFTEGFDGKNGWQLPEGAEHGRLASPSAAAALRQSGQLPTNILGLHEVASHGHRLELLDREDVAGVDYYVILMTVDDGFQIRYYIDPATFLITRSRVRKALHPDIDPTPTTIETVWSDFRVVAGVKLAFRETQMDLATGKLLETTTLLAVLPNPTLDDSLFRMP